MLWTRSFALNIRLQFFLFSSKKCIKDPLLVLENISHYVLPLKRTVSTRFGRNTKTWRLHHLFEVPGTIKAP